MSFMDSILNGLKIDPDDNIDESDYLTDEDSPEELAKLTSPKADTGNDEPRRSAFSVKPGTSRNKKLGNGMEVCVIKPTCVDDAREITDTLLGNRTVVLNMEGLDVDIAQRIIDFTSGSTYAIDGNLQKISHYIFIITPHSVDISGDFPTLMSDSFDVPQF